jgi:hypothetical protein
MSLEEQLIDCRSPFKDYCYYFKQESSSQLSTLGGAVMIVHQMDLKVRIGILREGQSASEHQPA